MDELVAQVVQLAVCVALLLFALNLGVKMLGVGRRGVRKLTNAIVDALFGIVAFPFRAIAWIVTWPFRR